jgi:hypothetical protein
MLATDRVSADRNSADARAACSLASPRVPDKLSDVINKHYPGDRWGRYSVVLLIEAPALADEEAGPYIAAEIVKWQRFEKASFVWDSKEKVATFSAVVPLARSASAAIGEARDAMENMLYAAVREPGDFEIKALQVELVAEA